MEKQHNTNNSSVGTLDSRFEIVQHTVYIVSVLQKSLFKINAFIVIKNS